MLMMPPHSVVLIAQCIRDYRQRVAMTGWHCIRLIAWHHISYNSTLTIDDYIPIQFEAIMDSVCIRIEIGDKWPAFICCLWTSGQRAGNQLGFSSLQFTNLDAESSSPPPSPIWRCKQTNRSHAQSSCEQLLFVCLTLVGSGRRAWEGNWLSEPIDAKSGWYFVHHIDILFMCRTAGHTNTLMIVIRVNCLERTIDKRLCYCPHSTHRDLSCKYVHISP